MKVLLAVDQSRSAKVAAHFLEAVRLPHGTGVSILHVIEMPHILPHVPDHHGRLAKWRRDARANAKQLIESVATPFQKQGLRVNVLVKEGLPGPTILQTLERGRTDLVVLGPHGLSRVVRFLLGSVSELTLSEAPCSVLVVRGRPRATPDRGLRVVLATDFSRDADAATALISTLELPPSSQITVVHVRERADDVMARFIAKGQSALEQAIEAAMRKARQRAWQLLERVTTRFVQRGLPATSLLADGYPAEEIIRVAERQRADLVVLGSRGLTALKRILFGSVSRKVARHASCSVLVVRSRR